MNYGGAGMTKLLPPLLLALVLGAIGLFSVWVAQPWLVPSLGSAAYTQLLTPDEPGAKPYSVGVGQLIGGAAGLFGVFVAGASAMPEFMHGHPLALHRVLAVLIAVLVGGAAQMAARATSPAGGATALVIALGAETANWAGAGRLATGIVLVTVLGESARQLIVRTR